jgi:ribosomal protein S4E
MFYEVIVQLNTEIESPNGDVKIKKINEKYLVEAVSVTDAEAIMYEDLKDYQLGDFMVKSVKESKIVSVISAETVKSDD